MLVELILGNATREVPLGQHELTDQQKDVLKSINAAPNKGFTNLYRLQNYLAKVGLPKKGVDLGRFLGQTESGPADEMFHGRPVWNWARQILMGKVDLKSFLKPAREMDAAIVAAWIFDLATAPYGLWHRWPQPAVPTKEQEVEDESALGEMLVVMASELVEPGFLVQYADFQMGALGFLSHLIMLRT